MDLKANVPSTKNLQNMMKKLETINWISMDETTIYVDFYRLKLEPKMPKLNSANRKLHFEVSSRHVAIDS